MYWVNATERVHFLGCGKIIRLRHDEIDRYATIVHTFKWQLAVLFVILIRCIQWVHIVYAQKSDKAETGVIFFKLLIMRHHTRNLDQLVQFRRA